MKLLTFADVFGRKVPVFLKEEMPGEFGHYDYENKRIVIAEKLNQKEFTSTYIHELGHAMFHRLNIELPTEIEEMLVENFVTLVSENLNPRLPPKLKKNLREIRSQVS